MASTPACGWGQWVALLPRFSTPDLEWDFRLKWVKSINTSGHKYGLVYPGVGWIIWRDRAELPEELIFHCNYLGGDLPNFALNFSRPGQSGFGPVLQLFAPGSRRVSQNPAKLPRYRPLPIQHNC